MSETTEFNIMGDRVIIDSEDSWRQCGNFKSGEFTSIAAGSIYNGAIHSSKKLRFNRKVHW